MADARFEYTADTQVDAVALYPASSNSRAGSSGSGSGSGSDSDEPEAPLLAVAQSALEGNLWGGAVALLDGATGERLCGAQFATGVSALAWTGVDRDVLALGCDNGDVQLTRLATDVDFAFIPVTDPARSERPGHDDIVSGVSASVLDRTSFATCSWDLTVKLWDVTAMDKTLSTLDGHTDLIWDVAMSPTTAHVLATASQDGTVQIWDDREVVQASGSTLVTQFPALSLDWHPTAAHIVSVGLEDGSVLTFDTRSPAAPLNRMPVHAGAIHRLKYSPFHADVLATGSDDTGVVIITNSSSAANAVTTTPLASSSTPQAPHRDYVRALAWYQSTQAKTEGTAPPRDALLVTGSWDKTVRSWSVGALIA